jgi:hypothetical protein
MGRTVQPYSEECALVFLKGPVLLNLQGVTGLGQQDVFPKSKQLRLLNG